MSVAFIFPGQGSQSVGMLGSIMDENPEYGEMAKVTFHLASEELGFDLWDIVKNGPVELLNKTENTQPALLASEVALWRIWCEKEGTMPVIMAGHSLGEYSALVCSEVLDFEETVALVHDRGRFMQNAVPEGEGAMAAILGMADEDVVAVCKKTSEETGMVVDAVNYNSPGQVVIAGNLQAVEKALENAKDAGAKKALKLPVSVPSHCSLMKPAAEKLAKKIQLMEFGKPTIPVINNVHVTIESEETIIADALVRQLSNPVRWVETIQKMKSEGIESIVECGPGKVLTGLNKRIDRELKTYPIFDVATIDKTLEELSNNDEG